MSATSKIETAISAFVGASTPEGQRAALGRLLGELQVYLELASDAEALAMVAAALQGIEDNRPVHLTGKTLRDMLPAVNLQPLRGD